MRKEKLKWVVQLYPNGNKKFQCQKTPKGCFHGIIRHWHPNGTLMAKGRLHHGKPVGFHYFWNEDGSLDSINQYRDGEQHGLQSEW